MVITQSVEPLPVRGRLAVTVVDGEWLAEHRGDPGAMLTPPADVVRDHRAGKNIMCTNGFTALAAAMVWAGLQDQAANLGVTSPTYLTPLWGAVGSGSGTVAKTDTALFAELARQTVGAGASSPATGSVSAEATWLFYFPTPAAMWTVTEAGLFAGATSIAGSGTLVDHWAFSPSVTVPTADSLILQVSLGMGP